MYTKLHPIMQLILSTGKEHSESYKYGIVHLDTITYVINSIKFKVTSTKRQSQTEEEEEKKQMDIFFTRLNIPALSS